MDKLTERMFEINKRKAEIRSDIEDKKEGIDFDACEKELRNLDTEFSDIEKRMKLVDQIKIEKPTETEKENRSMDEYTKDSKEYRSAFLMRLKRGHIVL